MSKSMLNKAPRKRNISGLGLLQPQVVTGASSQGSSKSISELKLRRARCALQVFQLQLHSRAEPINLLQLPSRRQIRFQR